VALRYLLDTSVLTRLVSPGIRAALEPEVASGSVGRFEMPDLEIGSSARHGDERDRLAHAPRAFPVVEASSEHFTRARWLQRDLAERGLRGRKVPDLLIAAAAEQHGLVVLHHDHAFEHVANGTGQDERGIVRQGSVS
jgi:predicted nucleic acid-binding protein